MGVVVQFDLAAWRLLFPEFAGVTDPQVQSCFTSATMFQINDGSGPVNDSAQALLLLDWLTAHVAQLQYGSSVQPVNSVVGRIASATEGSVSVQTDNQYPPGTAQWFQQTKYGSWWWAATAKYRTMQYRPGPRRSFNPSGVVLYNNR